LKYRFDTKFSVLSYLWKNICKNASALPLLAREISQCWRRPMQQQYWATRSASKQGCERYVLEVTELWNVKK
jgi:hypothetical protein